MARRPSIPKLPLWKPPIPKMPLLLLFFSIFFFSTFSISSSAPDSIHDLLRSKGLPPGLFPKRVKSYTFQSSGALEVVLDRPCLTKFDNLVLYDAVVTANLSYAALTGVSGLTQEELFLWLPVKDIVVEDPSSGLILFDIAVAHKRLSLSLFDVPPDCKPDDGVLGRIRQGTEKLLNASALIKPIKLQNPGAQKKSLKINLVV